MTRRGFGPDTMGEVAALMRRLLIDGQTPAKVRRDALALRRAIP
ncbi:hypothetical protein GCM10009525_34600 [Streptosporangium amethystogenes subsp. fukuiense]